MIPLRLEHVTKRFRRVVAVDDVSVGVEPGELFFLLGPSGCGKTTLLRVIAGFYAPDGGRVFFGDEDVTGRPPHRRNCGMVFQNYALWPHMSVLDNVAFGLGVRGLGRAERQRRALAVLEVVQMADFARRRPTQLSGGQQQRVALARALAIEPDYLLLDEPLSNLDAKLRLQMRTEIRRMQRAHRVTSVYVTHDQDEALSMADRVAVVRDGRVVALGTPRELYRNPPTAWVAGFLGTTNILEGKLVAREDGAAHLSTAFGNLRADRVTPEAAVGREVAISVRPEDLRLLPAGAPAPEANVFDVEILSRTFQGETEQARVRLGPHEMVVSGRPTDLPPAEAGEWARLFIPPEAIRVFAEENAAVSAQTS